MEEMVIREMLVTLVLVVCIIAVCSIMWTIFTFERRDSPKKNTDPETGHLEQDD